MKIITALPGFHKNLFFLLFLLLNQPGITLGFSEPMPSKNAELVISGTIIHREEIWDRRTNTLMGRPDALKEIIWKIRVASVIKGVPPAGGGIIAVSITGDKNIIESKYARLDTTGIFILTGNKSPFALVQFVANTPQAESTPSIPASYKARPAPPAARKTPGYFFPENVKASEIIKSTEMQRKAVSLVAKKYSMKDASFISMRSFSGPMPPDGGYIYWGVKGLINGKWHVWQPGYGPPREGYGLEDPQRYNKCLPPGTMILTPSGRTRISDLKPGDLVLTGSGKAVPIKKTARVKAENHKICRILFDDGTVLEISPGHPLPDKTPAGILEPGTFINNKKIIQNVRINYTHDYTYDILPESESGIYYAEGIALASTLSAP